MTKLDREDLSRVCGNLRYRLNLLAQTRRHTDRLLATRFNVFDYIQPDENRLSDMVADLIDPGGNHGQGNVFLNAFLSMLPATVSATWKFRSVRRENTTSFITNQQRRMDVLIDLGTIGVAIENKPWASEQEWQIHDYAAHLDGQFSGSFVIVYLSSDGTEPDSIAPDRREQLRREKKLVTWAYSAQFREWLTHCHQICAAEKVRAFLTDLIAFVEQTFTLKIVGPNLHSDE